MVLVYIVYMCVGLNITISLLWMVHLKDELFNNGFMSFGACKMQHNALYY